MNDEIGTLLTEEEVAEYLRVTKDALKLWRKEDRGPQYVRVEGTIRYPSKLLSMYLTGRAYPQPEPKEAA